jgi:hypothetical protein
VGERVVDMVDPPFAPVMTVAAGLGRVKWRSVTKTQIGTIA